MYKVFIPVLAMLFTGVIAFLVANTAASYMFPIFDNMSVEMTFMKGAGLYDDASAVIKNSFYIGLYILVCVPIAFILFRLLRRESQPQQQGFSELHG